MALGSTLVGCIGRLQSNEGSGGKRPPVERFAPSANSIDQFGSQLQEHGYTVWNVAVSELRSERASLSERGSEVFDAHIPVRYGVAHEEVGIDYESIDELLFLGSPRVNTFRLGMGHLGKFAASITVGDFSRRDVINSIGDRYPRDEHAGVTRFVDEDTPGEIVYAVDDGWLVTGFVPLPSASIDRERGDVNGYVETDPAVGRIVTHLSDTTFFSVTGHERTETTDLEENAIEGTVAEGFGHSLNGGDPSLDAVLVFDSASSIDEELIEEWADVQWGNDIDPSISGEDDTVHVSDDTATDLMDYSATPAFHPFVLASQSE